MADQRFGDERYDRYRQDDYRNEDDRGGYGRSAGDYGRSYQSRDRGERFGQSYGGRNEDRSFSDNGSDSYTGGTYGAEGYGARQYGSSNRGRIYGSGDQGRSYGNREAAGSMLHQGYSAPFGDKSGFDRNDFRQYDGEGQRYQYNNYQPTYDQPGRYAHAGPEQGYGQDRGLWEQTRDEVSSWFGDDRAALRRQMDNMRGDHHGGKGPKGYTRSDDRIREDLNDRLTADYRLDASDIDVKVDKGEVTLTGHVASRHDKRRAEDIADEIGGVKHVQNNLRVKGQDSATASTYSASGDTTGATATGTTGQTGQTSTARSN